jgi:hypothetical protein
MLEKGVLEPEFAKKMHWFLERDDLERMMTGKVDDALVDRDDVECSTELI